MLPRSNRRQHIRRWGELAEGIDRHIRSRSYSEAVRKNLGARSRLRDPAPFYFALMIELRENGRVLAPDSMESAALLQVLVGKEHVRATSVRCSASVDGRGLLTGTNYRVN
jgi:hypothetical protein